MARFRLSSQKYLVCENKGNPKGPSLAMKRSPFKSVLFGIVSPELSHIDCAAFSAFLVGLDEAVQTTNRGWKESPWVQTKVPSFPIATEGLA